MIAQLDATYLRLRPTKALTRLVSYAAFEGRPLTTRGRWINPLLFALFALQQRLPQLRPVQQPLYILGTGRSGTTLLGLLLSMHSDVGFLNEPKALWHAVLPDEDIIGSYSPTPGRYWLDADDASPAVCQRFHRLYGAYLAAIGARRVVDKYQECLFRLPFLRAVFPDARFIFLTRNGWDTCKSIDAWSKRKGIVGVEDWWGLRDRKWRLLVEQVVSRDPALAPLLPEIAGWHNHIDRAAVEWITAMRQGLQLAERYPECVHLLRYEDLLATPEASLTALLRFAGLPEDPMVLSYARQILRPGSPPARVKVHPRLAALFAQTSAALGYEHYSPAL